MSGRFDPLVRGARLFSRPHYGESSPVYQCASVHGSRRARVCLISRKRPAQKGAGREAPRPGERCAADRFPMGEVALRPPSTCCMLDAAGQSGAFQQQRNRIRDDGRRFNLAARLNSPRNQSKDGAPRLALGAAKRRQATPRLDSSPVDSRPLNKRPRPSL